jgi:hypothetical protein
MTMATFSTISKRRGCRRTPISHLHVLFEASRKGPGVPQMM